MFVIQLSFGCQWSMEPFHFNWQQTNIELLFFATKSLVSVDSWAGTAGPWCRRSRATSSSSTGVLGVLDLALQEES
jgi:hypothetical protein